MKIFVYGTLRKGGRWHDYWLSDARFVGAGKISAELYHLWNGLPAVVRVNQAQDTVLGEVYIVSEAVADKMDQFERGAGYKPVDGIVLMDVGTGAPIMAKVYEYQGSVAESDNERIASGDYITHIRKRIRKR